MEITEQASRTDSFSRIVVVALGILWFAFLAIVTYVEVETRSRLDDVYKRIWVNEQKIVMIETRQNIVFERLAAIEERMRDMERAHWRDKESERSRQYGP